MNEIIEKQDNIHVTECPICYENISPTIDFCVTGCKHSFCFKCIVTYSKISNSCPICRCDLQSIEEIKKNDTEYEDDSSNDEDEDEDEDEDRDIDSEDECSVEYITKILQKNGFTIQDAVSICLDRYSKIDTKYTKEYCEKLEENFYTIVEKLDDDTVEENEELIKMKLEDRIIV